MERKGPTYPQPAKAPAPLLTRKRQRPRRTLGGLVVNRYEVAQLRATIYASGIDKVGPIMEGVDADTVAGDLGTGGPEGVDVVVGVGSF